MRSSPCRTAPDRPSAAPANIARTVRGRRMSMTTVRAKAWIAESFDTMSQAVSLVVPTEADATASATRASSSRSSGIQRFMARLRR